MATITHIEEVTTTDKPTRYTAFDAPGKWVTNISPEHVGGFEFAAYYEPMQSQWSQSVKDGIYIEITCYQGERYLLRCHASRPTWGREQMNFDKRYATYEEAKQAALEWLPTAQAFCAGRMLTAAETGHRGRSSPGRQPAS